MRLVLALLMCLWLSPRPADACRCSRPPIGDAVARAEVVFFGTITKVTVDEKCDPKHPARCTRRYAYQVSVGGVWKGDVRPVVEIDAGHGRGDCSTGSLGEVENAQYLFVTPTAADGRFRPRLCGGSQLATKAAIAAVTKRLGAPVPATP